MDDRLPPAGRQRAGGFSEQMVEMQVGEADLAKLVGHPDQCGGRIRHVPEPRLALAQGREPALRLGERRIALFASRAQAQRCVRQNVAEAADLVDRRGDARNCFATGERRAGRHEPAQWLRNLRPQIDGEDRRRRQDEEAEAGKGPDPSAQPRIHQRLRNHGAHRPPGEARARLDDRNGAHVEILALPDSRRIGLALAKGRQARPPDDGGRVGNTGEGDPIPVRDPSHPALDVFPAQDALEPVHRREKAQQVDDLALVLHRDGDGVGRPIGHAARQDAGDHGPLRSGCQLTVERQGGLRQWGPARDRRIDQLLPVRLAQEDVEPDGFANEACLGVEILELRILQAGRRRQGLQHGDEPRRVAVDGQGDAANVLAGILLEPCPLCSGIAKQQDRGEQKPGSDQRHDEGDQVDLGREASIPDACEQPARRRALPPTGSRPFESRFHLALGLGALRLLVLDLGFPRLGVHGLSM